MQLTLPAYRAYKMLEAGGPTVKLTLYDKDLTTSDDKLGCAEVKLDGTSGKMAAVGLGGECTMSFGYAITPGVPPAATLTIRAVKAFNVPDKDKKKASGGSDPYLRFSLLECGDLDEVARTTVKPNEPNPTWSESLTLELPRGSPRPPLLCVRLWDDDLHDADDPLATTDVRLVPLTQEKASSSGSQSVDLVGIGRRNKGVKVSFEWTRVDDPEEEEDY